MIILGCMTAILAIALFVAVWTFQIREELLRGRVDLLNERIDATNARIDRLEAERSRT